jgi:hypothetical protein
VASGTPAELARDPASITGPWIRAELDAPAARRAKTGSPPPAADERTLKGSSRTRVRR